MVRVFYYKYVINGFASDEPACLSLLGVAFDFDGTDPTIHVSQAVALVEAEVEYVRFDTEPCVNGCGVYDHHVFRVIHEDPETMEYGIPIELNTLDGMFGLVDVVAVKE